MTLYRNISVLILALILPVIGNPMTSHAEIPSESAEALIAQIRKDTEWFGSYASRLIGQPGHDEALDALYLRVKALAGTYVWRHEVPFVVPQVLEATLTVKDGPLAGAHRLYPFWPTGPRLSTTPAEGIEGSLVYIGRATIEELPAHGLRDQIAVIEMTNGENWRNALAFGARAIVFLGSKGETQWDMRSHEMVVPLSVPRFYVPEGELAQVLRNRERRSGHIFSRGRWREAKGKNIYALIPSRHPERHRKAMVIVVQSDGPGMIPELATGADAAVDTALALSLLRYFADRPGAHPLLFVFLDGYSLNMKAIRYMLGALAVPPDDRKKKAREFESLLRKYKRYASLAAELRGDPQAVFKVHQSAYREIHSFIKDEASMEVLAVENELAPLRLHAYSLADQTPEKQMVELRISELDSRRIAYNVARKQMLEGQGQIFAKKLLSWSGAWDSGITADGLMRIEDHVVEKSRQLWQRAQARILGQVSDVEEILEENRIRDDIQGQLSRALNLPPEEEIPLSFVLGIDLSDAGIAVGPQTAGRMLHNQGGSHMVQFIEWLLKVDWAGMGESLPPGSVNALSSQAWTTGDSQNSYVIGERGMMTSQVASYGVPHMSWATLDGYRAKVDTPQDRVDRLNWQRLIPQIHLTAEVVKRLANDDTFQPISETGAKWGMVKGWVVAQAPGEPMARLPVKGYLASITTGRAAGGGVQAGRYNPKWWAYGGIGMRRQEFAFTGWDGYFYTRDLPSNLWTEIAQVTMQAHQLAEDGSIIGTIDLNSVRKENSFNAHLSSIKATPLTGTVFPCAEMNAFHLYDPRFLMEMGGITVTDANTGNIPKRLNFGLHDGIMGGLMEARVRWQIIQRIGITANRLMLLNMQETISDPNVKIREASSGFGVKEVLSRHPVHQAAYDMYVLDDRRLSDYRRAGIKSDAIETMRTRTKMLLDKVDEAIQVDDGSKMFYAASGALANEVRAYSAVRDLGNDVVRAVVFLLLVLIPFSFAMERLLFSSSHPYRQMTYTAVIFALMTGLLWSFHPAFRITSQPLIIIMAFGIIFMSAMVVSVIFLKFKSNVEEMKSEHAESSGASTSRLGLVSTAIKLGLANMRKRKLRTGLTGTTIVLITFAMLCFTSTSTYIGEKDLTLQLDKPPAYTGVLLRQPSQRRIRRRAELYLNNIIANMNLPGPDLTDYSEPPALNPKADVTYRYWWLQDPTYRSWRIHVRSPITGNQISITAGLGLQGNESDFTQVHTVLPNWRRFAELERTFEATQQGGCYLSDEAAGSLGVRPGDTVVISGRSMELVGTFDPDRLEDVEDLDGRNLMVINWGAMSDTQKWQSFEGDWDMTLLATEIQSGEGLTRKENVPYVPASQTVILPASMLRNFGLTSNSHLRTMAVRTDSVEAARAVAVEAGQRVAFPAYYGSPEAGVRILVFVPFLPEAPRSLWILMVLAGLIIFNTMMSSIAERKNEIYIYTSMGLAPLHIGVLFLAEAVTYGLMGSIFGYIAGQGLATVLGHLGWMGGLSLNYSGTHAIATMVMVVCITIVSSLIPAYRAGRLAVPSNKMRWAVPEPEYGVISDKLPFTVTDRTANGTILYLNDYFDAHRDGAIGCFIADELRLTAMTVDSMDDSSGSLPVMKLQATVSLAPYDLGVRQGVEITVAATDATEIFELDISLSHASGQPNNWKRLNKTFLGDLRRQLLGWRNLKARRMLTYIADAEEKLALMR
ncbi:MAG: ABC transporter permease [Desulfobacterales bacterium]